jgi:hypothetical protein
MREAGTEKLKRAELEDVHRTRIQPKKILKKREEIIEEVPAVDTPMEPLDDTIIGEDSDATVLEPMNEPDDMLDTSNFYEEVNDDIGRVDYEGPDLHDNMEDHIMSTMMDVLQTCGVSAADSANYCARVIKDKPMKASQFGDHYKPTFFEVYGQGTLCKHHTDVEETSMSMDFEHLIFAHSNRTEKRGISTRLPIGEKRANMLRRRNQGGSLDVHHAHVSLYGTKA